MVSACQCNIHYYYFKNRGCDSSYSLFVCFDSNYVYAGLRFLQKIPEIEKSLALVQYLKSKQDVSVETPVVTRYSLSETIFATSELDCNGTVNLWLGANVMLEYTYDDAIQLLSSKETNAKKEYQSVSCRHENSIELSEEKQARLHFIWFFFPQLAGCLYAPYFPIQVLEDLAFCRNQIITSEVR